MRWREWLSDDLHEVRAWVFALLVVGLLAFGAYRKVEAAEFSEGQQRERIVKAEEAQAKALQDIAASLKKLEKCR